MVRRISHRYDDKAVLQTIEKYMQDHLTIENVCHVLSLAELYNLTDLKLNCEFFIAYRFEKVAKTSAFKKLPQETKTALEVRKNSIVHNNINRMWAFIGQKEAR
jgi:hypothetical protein